MSVDSRTNQTADWIQREDQEGKRLDSGPYIGIVKENRDPLLTGRIQVWIPEFGGIETDPKYWRTISYASPFIGSTTQDPYGADQKTSGSDQNTFKTTRHTYGMWFSVPDLENWVLCTFVGGDPSRGYYFACIPNQLGHHMIPGIGSSTLWEAPADPVLKKVVKSGESYPVVEFNEYSSTVNWADIDQNRKPIHEPQLKILLEQGLDRKSLTRSRGIVESSSQRETPSNTFGISTPGRPASGYPDQKALSKNRRVATRLGGHSLVMDDGDIKGTNNLVRLRTAGGHQILLDDTEKMIYISNSTGSTYIELSAAGHLNVYSSNSINFRTKAELNIHVGSNMNVDVGGSFNLNVKGALNLQAGSITQRANSTMTLFGSSLKLGSSGALNLHTSGAGSFTGQAGLLFKGKTIGLNSGAGPVVSKPRDLPLKSLSETEKDGNGQWQLKPNKLKSVATIVPAHEPWDRKAGTASKLSNAVQDTSSDGANLEESESPDLSAATESTTADSEITVNQNYGSSPGDETVAGIDYGSEPGISQAVAENSNQTGLASAGDMVKENAPTVTSKDTVGPLDANQTKALLVQSAKNLTNSDFSATLKDGAAGAYALAADKLVNASYISRAAFDQYAKAPNLSLLDTKSWTGKDGIDNLGNFLANPAVQTSAKLFNMQKDYKDLLINGGIRSGDSNPIIGGMLNMAGTLPVGQVTAWRQSGLNTIDNYGNTATQLFNQGYHAVSKLGGGP